VKDKIKSRSLSKYLFLNQPKTFSGLKCMLYILELKEDIENRTITENNKHCVLNTNKYITIEKPFKKTQYIFPNKVNIIELIGYLLLLP
jgi:hypothetical protein